MLTGKSAALTIHAMELGRSNRRNFLHQASAFGLLHGANPFLAYSRKDLRDLAASPREKFKSTDAQTDSGLPMLRCLELTPFVDRLPLPSRLHASSTTLRLAMREVHSKVHRDVEPTRFWTYVDASSKSPTEMAPLIEAHSFQPLSIEWINQLPGRHFLPIDHSLHGCGREIPEVRSAVHLHGARVQSKYDGFPEDWFVPGQSRRCIYPFEQDGATLWYHDHAMGINRLNVYAGLFGMALVRDSREKALALPAGAYEIPIILCDRNFTADGQLYYPVSKDQAHPWVAEFTGDATLVNGKIRPYCEVEPTLYRLRILNVANSRFFRLSFSHQPKFQQIGSDQGLLVAPVSTIGLTLAPAERIDLVFDFSEYAGKEVHLLNGAFEILQFRVADTTMAVRSMPMELRAIAPIPESSATQTRTITLNEFQDVYAQPMVMLLNRKHWHEPVTEFPRLGSTEIWEFVNLTEDTHPMHLHLVRFQIVDRRAFAKFDYLTRNKLTYLSAPVLPEANERGWKDVVPCPPGMVTRIIIPFEGYTGKYLYHCHILEHEANDMMRPFEVVS